MNGTGAAKALPGRCSVLTALSCSETRGAALQALVSPARCRWPCGCEATGPCSPTGCNPTLNHAFCRTPAGHLRHHVRRPGLLDARARPALPRRVLAADVLWSCPACGLTTSCRMRGLLRRIDHRNKRLVLPSAAGATARRRFDIKGCRGGTGLGTPATARKKNKGLLM